MSPIIQVVNTEREFIIITKGFHRMSVYGKYKKNIVQCVIEKTIKI